ncbi:ARMT1-like domain-containing protein [Helicobacter sp. 11S03491-1]|uniref:damage-control phosphatase ARMT1 family protein n=1 Tax=Helicobacter sp. 11S03491-1 TaxID=1476196 RepID=UPI000BA79AE2|nr:ARMT1-like domain-containing protein [Helicobacter sp. 11S03491-1]PAF43736.1 hypothetical protein BKH45_00250 [Helicobacter sp. 11S03491-1]
MKIKKECFSCLNNQCQQTLHLASLSQETSQKITTTITSLLHSLHHIQAPPPQVAIDVYDSIASISCISDIYQSIKAECIHKAREITDFVLKNKPLFQNPHAYLKWAIKIAALGNIIDYGSQTKFDIHTQNFNLENLDFGLFDFDEFAHKLESSKTLLYFGDNAGENIFDEVLLEALKTLYPHVHLIYLTRGSPIINDITFADLHFYPECKKIFEICEVQDSGVKSPGFIYELANTKTQKLFDKADLILAKGMGNFECLESRADSRVFLLFKIKCEVVANHLNIPIGKMIFRQNTKTYSQNF